MNTKESAKRLVHVQDWGTIDYKEAWDRQMALQQDIIHKKRNRNLFDYSGPFTLIFCEHPKVFTLGRSGKDSNLLINESLLKYNQIDFYKINRGGDITYHGPGQMVLYPILDLDYFFSDVHLYVRKLEQIVIETLKDYQIEAYRNPDFTGVWLRSRIDGRAKKICALGVHLSRWVTLHGIAFNIHTDLTPFNFIVPCGIQDPEKGVTSLHLETDVPIQMNEIKSKVQYYFASEFDCQYIHLL